VRRTRKNFSVFLPLAAYAYAPVLFTCKFVFVVTHIAFSYLVGLNQEIRWEERLRHYIFCIEWNIKPWA